MDWDAQKYSESCGRVTEHGAKLVGALRNMRCGRVLDLGCGTGDLTNDIAGFARAVVGVDSSPAMIAEAKARYPGIEFYVMDACSMPWDAYFDAVFSNAVFHFILAQDDLLDSVWKVLAYGGALVCEFGAAGNIAGLLDAVAAACAKRGRAYAMRFFYPSGEEYRDLLLRHGFAIESLEVYSLDTQLKGGEAGLRNWIEQVFCVEMAWFGIAEKGVALSEIESALRPTQWDGSNWRLPNKRIRVIARKR